MISKTNNIEKQSDIKRFLSPSFLASMKFIIKYRTNPILHKRIKQSSPNKLYTVAIFLTIHFSHNNLSVAHHSVHFFYKNFIFVNNFLPYCDLHQIFTIFLKLHFLHKYLNPQFLNFNKSLQCCHILKQKSH